MKNSVEIWLNQLLPFVDSTNGIYLFIILYALSVTCLVPGAWFSMLSGLIYGTWLGSFVVILGAFLGAELSFYLGRKLLRDWIQKRIAGLPRMEAFSKALGREGLKVIFLSRLSPAFPFGLLNYAYSVSNVTGRNFTLGLLGIVPGTIFYCSLGSLAGEISRFPEVLSGRTDLVSFIFTFVSIIATCIVFWLVIKGTQDIFQEFDSSN